MGSTNIEWTDTVWNPLVGCTWASSGCDHCYAAVMSRRLEAMAKADIAAGRDPGKKAKYIGITNKNKAGRIMFNGVVKLDDAALTEPKTWKTPRRVFVNSMSDLFHKDVPFVFIADVFSAMRNAPQHIFQVLTKRPERMAQFFREWVRPGYIYDNVWLGTSVENQEQADKRIPHLLSVPAKVRFLSIEPLLGPVEIGLFGTVPRDICASYTLMWQMLDWVIVGGESGPGARPMHPDWVRSIRDECRPAGVAFFFKQWGEYEPYEEDAQPPFWNDQHGRMHDGHGLDILDPETGEIGRGWHPDSEYCDVAYRRVGKKAAGRLLDGREWNEVPS